MSEPVAATLILCALAAALWRFGRDGARAPGREAKIVRIDALLPQTQCGECGYPGCRPYARAIVEQDAPLNLCPPGGDAVVARMGRLLGRSARHHGAAPPFVSATALIDEENCIGCVKCVAACPVDAIIGAAGQLHGVAPQYCTGCGLCLPPCPVDCISMAPS